MLFYLLFKFKYYLIKKKINTELLDCYFCVYDKFYYRLIFTQKLTRLANKT